MLICVCTKRVAQPGITCAAIGSSNYRCSAPARSEHWRALGRLPSAFHSFSVGVTFQEVALVGSRLEAGSKIGLICCIAGFEAIVPFCTEAA